jgi:hypothetical protein
MRSLWRLLVPAGILLAGLVSIPALPGEEPAPAAAEAPRDETPAEVQPPPPGVPPLLIGPFYRYQRQIGPVLAVAWQGPLAVLPGLAIPPRNYFDLIRDGEGLPVLPEDLDPQDPRKSLELEIQLAEVKAFHDALNHAYTYKPLQFAASAQHDLSWHHLVNAPLRNRGKVIHLEGNLRRLLQHDLPLGVRTDTRQHYYEGWVFQDDSNDPWCIVFIELPEGLKPADAMKQPVAFDGYFFKRLGYRNELKQPVSAPMLVGNSPLLRGPVADNAVGPALAWSGVLLYGIFAIVVVVVVLASALTWWFRRGDALVRGRLSEIAHRNFVDPSTVDLPSGEIPTAQDPEPPIPPRD